MASCSFAVIIEPNELGLHAYAPVSPGCHTFADTIDEACANILEAIEPHIQRMLEDSESVPIEYEPMFVTHFSASMSVTA